MSYFMGIDLGTSSVKVLIADETGKTFGIGQKGYEVYTPQVGYAQQEPQEWWESTVEAIKEAFVKAGVGGEEIAGLSFSGQMHGMVALDAERQLVCPALIHLDGRSAAERDEIKEIAAELMDTELLNQPGTGMIICSLYWTKKNQPDVYEKIAYIMSPKDYIRYRLTGSIECEFSDASSTLCFSVKNGHWCYELFRRLGLKEDIWPDVVPSTAVTGTVSPEAASLTGLSVRTKVVAGGGDAAMALIGNGIVNSGIVACNIGTASQVAAFLDTPQYDPKMRIQTWCHPIPDRWYIQGGTLNGGNTLSWLRNKVLRSTEAFEKMDAEAAEIPAGSEGLLFLPYLAGERTPFQDPYAKGVFFGMSMKHGQAHMVRAVMEGVVFNLYECLKILDELGIRREKLISAGGGARGKAWKQIQADILDMPVYTTETREEACMGAVILAATGCGYYGSVQEACDRCVKVCDTPVLPIQENTIRYSEQQKVFTELYQNVKGIYRKL